MKNQTYSDLLRQYYDWQWECDFRTSVQDTDNFIYAFKKMRAVEKLLRTFEAVNLMREAA